MHDNDDKLGRRIRAFQESLDWEEDSSVVNVNVSLPSSPTVKERVKHAAESVFPEGKRVKRGSLAAIIAGVLIALAEIARRLLE